MEYAVDVYQRIKALREKLNKLLVCNELNDLSVYQVSTELDKLIADYYKQKK